MQKQSHDLHCFQNLVWLLLSSTAATRQHLHTWRETHNEPLTTIHEGIYGHRHLTGASVSTYSTCVPDERPTMSHWQSFAKASTVIVIWKAQCTSVQFQRSCTSSVQLLVHQCHRPCQLSRIFKTYLFNQLFGYLMSHHDVTCACSFAYRD